jgi:hypothetical protein
MYFMALRFVLKIQVFVIITFLFYRKLTINDLASFMVKNIERWAKIYCLVWCFVASEIDSGVLCIA